MQFQGGKATQNRTTNIENRRGGGRCDVCGLDNLAWYEKSMPTPLPPVTSHRWRLMD